MDGFFARFKAPDPDARNTTVSVILLAAGGALVAAIVNISPMPLFATGSVLLICAAIAWGNYLKLGQRLALLSSFLTLAYLILHNLGIRDASMFGLAVLLIGASLLEGKRGIVVFGILNASLIGVVELAEMHGAIHNAFSSSNTISDYIATEISFILICVFLWFVVDRLNQNFNKARQELSDRLLLENKLRDSEAQYRELVEYLPIVVYMAEPGRDGRWLYVSPKINDLTGYPAEKWLADPNFWYEHIHPQDQERVVQEEMRAIEQGGMPALEYRFFDKDGNILWLHDQSLKRADLQDQRVYQQGFMMDITAKKQAERLLRESEEKYHTLFDATFRQAQELSLLAQIQNAIASELDLQTILRAVVEATASTFGYSLVSLYLLQGETLYMQHQVGYTHSIFTLPKSKGVMGRVARTGIPAFIQDTSADPDFLEAVSGIKSEMCVPLFDEKEICGVLNIESTEVLRFSHDDFDMMNSLSQQVSLAIRRARLYDERDESLRREKGLNELSRAVSSSLDLKVILKKVAKLSADMVGAETGNVSIMSDDGLEMLEVYHFNESSDLYTGPTQKGEGLMWLAYETGQAIVLDEYAEHPSAMAKWASTGLHAYMAVPIAVGGKKLGSLAVYNRDSEKKFRERDLILLEAAAAQTAIAIQNARLFKELQDELNEHKRMETERQIAEEAIQRYADIVNNIQIGLYVMSAADINNDKSLRVTAANPKAFKAMEKKPEQVIGRTFDEVFQTLRAKGFAGKYMEVLQTGVSADLEDIYYDGPNGSISEAYSVKAFRLPNQHIGIAFEDITSRKQAEAEQEKLIRELEDKNAELERFTYTVSHDLKAPLVTIRGFLGLLEEDALQGNVERIHRDSQRITEASAKMQRLLNELLELSRIGRLSNPPENIPFDVIVRDALSLLEGTLTARQIQVEVGGDLPTVHGDRVRLTEVIQNLVDNAAKFMGNQAEPKIVIGAVHQNEGTRFFVRDNGMGLEPRFQEKIFGLFDKLDPSSEGTGVGLALVKRIIEIHHGRIWAESEGSGKGTTFWFTLPVGQNQK